jgi:chromate reductase
MTVTRVLGIAGSLRQGSHNRAALRAAAELAPEGLVIEPHDLRPIPLYDGDVEARGFPAAVQELRACIAGAEAVLFVTPEYNHSVPGVLKNAIDWASRPPDQPFAGKPVAIMGVSSGVFGTTRAQYHLRQTCTALGMLALPSPQVLIGQAQQRFDADGRLTDEPTRRLVRTFLEALLGWTRRLRSP